MKASVSSVMKNQSLQAKRELLRSFEPKLLVNLAALHDQKLFPSAKQPAIVLVAANRQSDDRASFPFVSVEFSRPFRKHGILQIGPENVKRMSVSLGRFEPVSRLKWHHGARHAIWRLSTGLLAIMRTTLEKFLAKYGLEMYIRGISRGMRRIVRARFLLNCHDLPCLAGGEMPPFEVSVDGLPKFKENVPRPRRAISPVASRRGYLPRPASPLRKRPQRETESSLRTAGMTLCTRGRNLEFR